MDAVKAAYAPLKITLTDTEAVIENRNLFTDLNAYDLVFASSVNGNRNAVRCCGQTASRVRRCTSRSRSLCRKQGFPA